jgi:hypothetical protein
LDHALDLLLPANDRIQFILLSQVGQVYGQSVYQWGLSGFALPLSSEDQLPLQHPVGIAADLLARDAQMAKYIYGGAVTLANQSQQEMVRIYLRIASVTGHVACQFNHSFGTGREVEFCVDQGRTPSRSAESLDQVLHVARLQPYLAQHAAGGSFFLAQEPQQEMLGADLPMVHALGLLMGQLECSSRRPGKELR